VIDAIVIGSGPNGLAAAIRLAEAGRSVTLLEAADHPGGAVWTEELTLPGFHHDTCSSVYPAGAASPVFERMPLGEHGLEWVHPRVASAHPLEGGRALALHRDLATTVQGLDRLHPGDGSRWAAFVQPFLDSWEAVRATMLSGFPPVSGPLRLIAGGGPRTTLGWARLLPESAVGLGHRLFAAPEATAWLLGAAMHGDTTPQKPGGAIAAAYLNLLGHAVGWPSPRGGARRLTDALVGYLLSLGGELRTGARVERILSAGGRVTGVGVAGGEEFATNIVIADVMPHALIRLAGEGLARWYRAALSRYVYGPATVKVDWALDGPIPWLDDQLRGAGTVHVGGSEDEVLSSIEAAQDGIAERPFLLLGQQSIADPSRAPAGKHTAWAYTHGPSQGVDWPREQERHADRIEARVEHYAPGFRERILARHLLGPTDLEARNPNLVGGDVGGGSYRLSQVIFRPIPSPSPYRTPLRGLYLGSAATFPGGAVHGVCGDAAARAALSPIW
jgi:phytoene dehydrogenase-like protein